MSANLNRALTSLHHASDLLAAIERHIKRLEDEWACYANGLYQADIHKKAYQVERTLEKATEHVSNAETANESLHGLPTTEFWEKIFIKTDETRILMTRLQALHDR
jgi:phage shock protein A